ncbi:MAG: hypothetical protein COA92_08485 [Sulfurovum sp.]|nr:MAG: hypothetical protein COA92_08485 [Sulfurovum sp.]
MYKLYKWFLVSVALVFLSACGGGSGNDVSGDTSLPNVQTIAIDKIKAYANDNTQELPSIEDYKDAGVEGVSVDNIDAVNEIVATLTASDVDTPEKINILLDENGLTIIDTTLPVITLIGANPQILTVGDVYIELNATANDTVDGDISANIIIDASTVNTAVEGNYTVTYNVSDAAGNAAIQLTRTVNVVAALPLGNPTWTFHPSVAQGTQFDAQTGPNNLIHLITNSYYQLDLSGTVLVNENQGDAQQGLLGFPPAIAVGDDGSVHIVTRDAGNVSTGVNIRYRKRSSAGSWDTNYVFRTPVPRNYVVGVGWADSNNIILSASDSSTDPNGLFGYIHLWQAGVVSATYLGRSNAIWRADVDSRIRAKNSLVNLISGNTDRTGEVYFSKTNSGTGIVNRLNTSMKIHEAGNPRRGFPDQAIDLQNNTHIVYGSDSEVYYNKYDANGQKLFTNDKRIFTNLGTWHLNTGLSAVAVSESGSIVVIVALRTKGDNLAANSDVLWAYSTDGGLSWSAPQDTLKNTDAGEGRRRPRLVAVGDTFVLLYGDTLTSGISMGVLTFP